MRVARWREEAGERRRLSCLAASAGRLFCGARGLRFVVRAAATLCEDPTRSCAQRSEGRLGSHAALEIRALVACSCTTTYLTMQARSHTFFSPLSILCVFCARPSAVARTLQWGTAVRTLLAPAAGGRPCRMRPPLLPPLPLVHLSRASVTATGGPALHHRAGGLATPATAPHAACAQEGVILLTASRLAFPVPPCALRVSHLECGARCDGRGTSGQGPRNHTPQSYDASGTHAGTAAQYEASRKDEEKAWPACRQVAKNSSRPWLRLARVCLPVPLGQHHHHHRQHHNQPPRIPLRLRPPSHPRAKLALSAPTTARARPWPARPNVVLARFGS